MSVLMTKIASTLAEFDRKDWDTISLGEQMPYIARALMVTHVVREHGIQDEAIPDPVIVMDGLSALGVSTVRLVS
jgi:hypothetical protein